MEKIIDLILNTPYESVEEKIKLHYGDRFLFEFRDLYHKLLNLKSGYENTENLRIHITAFSEKDDEDIMMKEFDEDDASLYYDVSAYEGSDNTVYSIASSSYSDFIQYYVDSETVERFSAASILAHCLWEITSYGFEDNF